MTARRHITCSSPGLACLDYLQSADDIILVAKSAADLKQMLEELDRISKEAGLSMNPEKTKLMINTSEDRIHLNGQPLEYVEDYTYLGQNLSSSNSKKEIKRRISMAWKKFWSLKFILTDKFQKLSLKERGATQPYRHERRPNHPRKPEVEMGRARGKDGPQTTDEQTDIVGSQDRQKKTQRWSSPRVTKRLLVSESSALLVTTSARRDGRSLKRFAFR
ncbi:hypothetical protein ANN_01877 [Periplaneta americana]|uniref:Reverse transcriptase domain-containing protein n=1 Tax=Periplaneta americana TaxID=6978 RepID=A0ABQ8TXP8_PERAM|nr:hypothetical protein ANN_01877 [Periplaneta americana]